VRVLGEVKPEYAALLQRADAIFIDELRATIDPATGKSSRVRHQKPISSEFLAPAPM
jgi:GMP synthase PP-ATPase subunit